MTSQNNEPIIIISHDREGLDDSDDDASLLHQQHGLGVDPIHLGASSNSVFQKAEQSSAVEEQYSSPVLKPKKKKWSKRFQFKSFAKFRSRLARKPIHRDVYPPVYINDLQLNREGKFPDNSIRTSKYTAWSFVPKVLYEQFRKATSIYFLLIVILTSIPVISPISPWTSLLGLLFIVVVAGIREGYEDFLRHVADRTVNQREYEVIGTTGSPVPVRSENLKVGQLVLLRRDQETPADCVLIASSDPQGTAYIQTAQLDGETNLKVVTAPATTKHFNTDSVRQLRGYLNCELPLHHLYQFYGSLRIQHSDNIESEPTPLQANSLLLRGTFLKNTDWAIGLIAYAGKETKLSLNSNDAPSKFSTLDKRLNIYVIGILIFMTLLSMLLGTLGGFFERNNVPDMTYLAPDEADGPVVVGIITTFSYFILLSYLIPLSMIVSLEIIKVLQSKWMEWDLLMTSPDGRPMTAKTSDLNDELALVRYIFSDKTGTLTENIMEFSKCAVRGHVFHHPLQGELASHVDAGGPTAEYARLFLTALAVCHNVVVAPNSDQFQAASPDEEALCMAAKANRFTFLGRPRQNLIQVQIAHSQVTFEVLCEFPFTSARRRMSIVVRSDAVADGQPMLFSKGADTEIFSRLRPSGPSLDDSEALLRSEENIGAFSRSGLRTLAVGLRVLSSEETERLMSRLDACTGIIDASRTEALEQLADEWERDLQLLGITAIEDRLQPLVAETISFLQQANIAVWMITGDKQETAINIGYACKLLQTDMDVLVLNAENTVQCKDLIQSLTQRGLETSHSRHALVVDGETLRFVLEEHDIAFLDLALNCQAVIVCRATPLQKANIVKLVRERVNACCLAIGDGANDVSMIQEANVGIGIYGREGTLAARSSDYALSRFCHLQRLLAVHGRYALIRNAFVVHYSFYKNAAVFLSQVWFGFWCGFSAQSLYDDWLMTLYNIFITSLPPLFVGIFERDCPEPLLNRYPSLYTRTQSDTIFTLKTLGMWMISAVYHSLVLALGTITIWENDVLRSNGHVAGLTALGNAVLTASVIVVFLKAALEIQYWPWIVHLGLWGSLVIYFAIFAIESQFPSFIPPQYEQFSTLFDMGPFWFWMILVPVFALLPDFILKSVQKIFFPEDWEILRERYLRLRLNLEDDEINYGTTDLSPFTEIEPLRYSHAFQTSPNSFDAQFQEYSRSNTKSKSPYLVFQDDNHPDQPLLS